MTWAKLTNANGDEVWVQAQWIQMVRSPLPEDRGVADGTVNAVVILSGHRMAVRETVAQVMALC